MKIDHDSRKGKAYRLLCCALGLAVVLWQGPVHAETEDECVLRSMKGVTSNTGAALVAKACREKVQRERDTVIRRQFGAQVGADAFELETGYQEFDDGLVGLRMVNRAQATIITYIKLGVVEAPPENPKAKPYSYEWFRGLAWDLTEPTKEYYYKVSVKPGAAVWLKFRRPAAKQWAAKSLEVFGRDRAWTDTLSSSSAVALPEATDPMPR